MKWSLHFEWPMWIRREFDVDLIQNLKENTKYCGKFQDKEIVSLTTVVERRNSTSTGAIFSILIHFIWNIWIFSIGNPEKFFKVY